MADLHCPAFIPMYVHGDYHCAHCGLTLENHKAYVDHGMMTSHDHHQQQPQLLIDPYPPQPDPEPYPGLAVLGHDVIPHNNRHHLLPMEEIMQPNYEAQLEKENNVNMVNNNNYNAGNGAVPAIRSWVFSEYQIVRMFGMAGRYQWSLRGHSRNEELHQFCDEIGISWTQFSNWVHRNRARFGPQSNSHWIG